MHNEEEAAAQSKTVEYKQVVRGCYSVFVQFFSFCRNSLFLVFQLVHAFFQSHLLMRRTVKCLFSEGVKMLFSQSNWTETSPFPFSFDFVNFQDVPSKRPTVQLQSESNRSEVSDESDSFIMDVEEEGRRGETSTADINNTTRACAVSQPENGDRKLKNGQQMTKRAESVGSDGSSASKPAPSKRQLRAPCPYGKDCYRYVTSRWVFQSK